MAGLQKKISQLPADSAPTIGDSIPTLDNETSLTKRATITDLITLFFNNIPAGTGSPITRWVEVGFDHIANNTGVWSGDAYASTRAASMSAMTIYINGRRITVNAVVARTFTASKDTYVDVLDNLDGTGTLVYTEVTNNAASPALAANSVRVGIIVTGATTIASVASINQGQETKLLPIASSVPYQVTDSLGNLIAPRDPNRRVLGLRQCTSNFTTASTTVVQITGLSVHVIVPLGRKVNIYARTHGLYNSVGGARTDLEVWDGTVGSGTKVGGCWGMAAAMAGAYGAIAEGQQTPASASKTYNAGLYSGSGGGTSTYSAPSGSPGFLRITLD